MCLAMYVVTLIGILVSVFQRNVFLALTNSFLHGRGHNTWQIFQEVNYISSGLPTFSKTLGCDLVGPTKMLLRTKQPLCVFAHVFVCLTSSLLLSDPQAQIQGLEALLLTCSLCVSGLLIFLSTIARFALKSSKTQVHFCPINR